MAAMSRQFGPFRVVRRLGVGGMAETFEAARQGPGGFEQRVCLKRVLPAFSQDEEFVKQFQREARLAASLRHSNIVGVLDFGEIDGLHYMALELIDGVDLRAFLAAQEGKRLSAEQAALIGMDLAYALEYAHNPTHTENGHGASNGAGALGIVHRDVSSANVLISRAGEIKLADFGIAKAISTAASTASQTIKGKIPYMAPEQMKGLAVDGRADLFSLGVLLFEAVTGERPFDGSHDVETMTRVLAGERKTVHELAPALPTALATAIERLLEIEPDDRTADASALLQDLAKTAPSPQVRRELAFAVESRLGGVGTRVHVREQQEITTRELADRPLVADLPTTNPGLEPASRRRRLRIAGMIAGLVGATALAAALWNPSGPTGEQAPVIEQRSVVSPETETGTEAEAETETGTEAEAEAASETGTVSATDSEPATTETAQPVAPKAKPVPAESRDGKLKVTVVPWGLVWVDGKYMGRAPITVPLPPGSHKVQAGYNTPTKTKTIRIRSGRTTRREIELD